jgi:hypothetical protein
MDLKAKIRELRYEKKEEKRNRRSMQWQYHQPQLK